MLIDFDWNVSILINKIWVLWTNSTASWIFSKLDFIEDPTFWNFTIRGPPVLLNPLTTALFPLNTYCIRFNTAPLLNRTPPSQFSCQEQFFMGFYVVILGQNLFTVGLSICVTLKKMAAQAEHIFDTFEYFWVDHKFFVTVWSPGGVIIALAENWNFELKFFW